LNVLLKGLSAFLGEEGFVSAIATNVSLRNNSRGFTPGFVVPALQAELNNSTSKLLNISPSNLSTPQLLNISTSKQLNSSTLQLSSTSKISPNSSLVSQVAHEQKLLKLS